jgi:hypothetical protein
MPLPGDGSLTGKPHEPLRAEMAAQPKVKAEYVSLRSDASEG